MDLQAKGLQIIIFILILGFHPEHPATVNISGFALGFRL